MLLALIIEVIFLKPEFEKYMNLLLEWNEKINLTAITDPAEIETKHFADSLTCLASGYIKDGCSLVDVGTGAHRRRKIVVWIPSWLYNRRFHRNY